MMPVLNTVYSQILLEYSNANAEMMICPTNASWEADVIIISNAYGTDDNLIEKSEMWLQARLYFFLKTKKRIRIVSEILIEKLQHLFPSKIVQSFE
jgi:hypothetical protein